MNKSEIQARIEKCESELATLKADLAKCDCEDGIEQEKCWHTVSANGLEIRVLDYTGTPKAADHITTSYQRRAYMPECRQVTAKDAKTIYGESMFPSLEDMAHRLHKLGVRMKVTP